MTWRKLFKVSPIVAAVEMLVFSSFAFVFLTAGTYAVQSSDTQSRGFNANGNVLISDQFNNRAVEIDRKGHIVWSFGSNDPTLCNPGPGAIIGLNDAERLGDGLTLLSGTGIPAGASSLLPAGCVDNRVIVVNKSGHIVWQYGQAMITG